MRREYSSVELARLLGVTCGWLRKVARLEGWTFRKPRRLEGKFHIFRTEDLPDRVRARIAERTSSKPTETGPPQPDREGPT